MKKVSIILLSLMTFYITGCTDHAPDAIINPQVEEVNAWQAGGLDNDTGRNVAVDKDGNVYVAGTFGKSIKFGSTTLTSNDFYDVFLVKYNRNGEVQWAYQAGSANNEEVHGIAIDKDDNVYVTGNFSGSGIFGRTILNSRGTGFDIFIMKFNKDGVSQWAQSAGSSEGHDRSSDIAVGGDGNLYVTGSFTGTAYFGTASVTATGNIAEPDLFIAKYNSNGVVQWVRKDGGQSNDYGQSIAADDAGNVYVTGTFLLNMTIGSTTLVSRGKEDAFVAKYNELGEPVWVRQIGSTGIDEAQAIGLDSQGDVYTAGNFTTSITIHETVLDGPTASFKDIFIAKFSKDGIVEWAQRVGSTRFGEAQEMVVDADGTMYLTGAFEETINFSDHSLTSGGIYDMFMVKINSDGTSQWAQQIGGIHADIGYDIALDTKRRTVFATGYFQNSLTHDSTTLTSRGLLDMYVVKYQE